MTSIFLSGVSKNYGAFQALHQVDFTVENGEMLTLLGPSGCGKTTMLRLIAGLLEPTTGKILFDKTVVNSVPPHKRNVGLVFQNYSLFPHMTVFQNVAFGLRMRGVDDQQIKTQVQQMLDMVQLGSVGDRYPTQLSGGQQQRVGLARALVIKPAVLLLDEPFGALDAFTRMYLQDELLRLWQEKRPTVVFVTHDLEEAVYLGGRVVLMAPGPGRVQKVIDVCLPWPRERTGESLGKYRRELYEEFHLVHHQAAGEAEFVI
jgi:NitT/TauT family transport system ATP-binding protein